MTIVLQNAPQFHQVGIKREKKSYETFLLNTILTKMLQDIGKRGKNEIIVTEKL